MNDNFVFKLDVLEAKGLGPDLNAVLTTATFANQPQNTAYSVAGDHHIWNTTLQWNVDKQQLRRLASVGANTCKVQLATKDGTKLGWVVIDLRSAKLQHSYKKDPKSEGAFSRNGAAPSADHARAHLLHAHLVPVA